MKLAYIANARIPTEKAHGLQIMKMCEAFSLSKIKHQKSKIFSRGGSASGGKNTNQNAKIKAELLVPKRFNKIKNDPFEYYDIQNKFKIIKLPCLDFTTFNLLGRVGFFIQTITFLISAKIYLFFRRYDIIYTREQLAGIFFRNFVFEIHSLPERTTNFHTKLWRKAKALIVLTSFIKNELANFENKILIAPDGVDLKKFNIEVSKKEAREKLNLPLDKKIIVYTGSFYLYDWKGVDVFIESARYFSDDYILLLVGGKNEEIKQIRKKYEFKNIMPVGRRTHAEIPYYLKAADALILPNKKGDKMSEQYTSPLKLFEYMASGKPIIASDIPSIREILNEDNAIFMEPNNPKALAEAVKIVLKNKNFSDKVARQALEDAKQHSWDSRAQTILDFIA